MSLLYVCVCARLYVCPCVCQTWYPRAPEGKEYLMLIWGNLCWVCIITFIVTPRLIRLDRGGSDERSQHVFSLRSDALNDLKLRIQWYVCIFVSTDQKKISCSINFSNKLHCPTNSFDQPINAYRPLSFESDKCTNYTEVFFYVLLCRSGMNAVPCSIGSCSAQLNA